MAVQDLPGTELDAQYRVLKESAGVLEVADRTWVRAGGADAGEYLEGQLTNEIASLDPGAGTYAALLDRKGRMQTDLRVVRTGEQEFLLDCFSGTLDDVLKHLNTYKVASQVEFEPLTDRVCLALVGPAAPTLLEVRPLAEHGSAPAQAGPVAGTAVGTRLGLDFICGSTDAAEAMARLTAGDAEQVEQAAADILRVELGIPAFGRELDTSTIPQEAGLNERAVSFTKGCYVGQETVARLHYKGKPNRHLRRLVCEAPVAAGDPIATGEREVGTVGTAVVSPTRGPLALAVVRREAEPGSKVTIGDRHVTASVEEIG